MTSVAVSKGHNEIALRRSVKDIVRKGCSFSFQLDESSMWKGELKKSNTFFPETQQDLLKETARLPRAEY